MAFDGELDIEIAGLGSLDILKILGMVHFDGAHLHFIFEGYNPHAGDTFDFLDELFDGTYTITREGLAAGYDFRLDSDLNLVTTQAPVAVTPVPGTLLGLGGLGALRRAPPSASEQ